MKANKHQFNHRRLRIALAGAAAATVAGFSAAQADEHTQKFVLNVSEVGHLSAAELSPPEGTPEETAEGSGFREFAATTPLDKLAAALLKFLARSHELICDIPLSPSQVAFTFEVVQVQWSKKVLCQAQARQALRQALEESDGNTGAPVVTFNFPKNLLDLSKFKDQFDRQKQMEAFQNFSAELVTFFCRLPVRPDELSLKVLPAKVEWDISEACKQAL